MTVTNSDRQGDTPSAALAAGAAHLHPTSAASTLPMPRWGYRYTPEERDTLRRLATEGKRPEEIAAAMGRPVSSIRRLVCGVARKRREYRRRPNKWNRFEQDRLEKFLRAGRKPRDLGPEFDTSRYAVEMAVTRYGLRHLCGKPRRRA